MTTTFDLKPPYPTCPTCGNPTDGVTGRYPVEYWFERFFEAANGGEGEYDAGLTVGEALP